MASNTREWHGKHGPCVGAVVTRLVKIDVKWVYFYIRSHSVDVNSSRMVQDAKMEASSPVTDTRLYVFKLKQV